MSESLLRTLMQLFAIVANVNNDVISESSKDIVASYLKSFLPQNLVDYYLELFKESLHKHHSEIKNSNSRQSLHGIKLLKYCQEINEQLVQSQKHVVIIELLEFIKNGENITEKELEFAETIAQVFNISDDEYEHCKSFVLDPNFTLHDCILIADKNPSHPNEKIRHIQRDNINGQLVVLHIQSTNMFFFRYTGNDNIYLNNQNILPNRTFTLDAGASIGNSKVKTIYYHEISEKLIESSSFPHIFFIADNISFNYKGNGNDSGIKDLNLNEHSGSMLGILGLSGTGKSTLLSLLNGKLKPDKGRILINNEDINSPKIKNKTIIGYVPQDDLLIEELTVFQNLFFNAQLCFGNLSDAEINKRVINILKDFDLYDIRSLKVGNPLHKYISGGERKRLNIALELIREPYILFVDEPTSGLSSMDSMLVTSLLKKQTLKGKLIITTIHQPSSEIYKTFDKILVLDKGGYTIYYGNPIEAISYFKFISQQANFSTTQCNSCGNLNPEIILHTVDAKVVDEYGRLSRHRKISPEEWHQHYLLHKTNTPQDYFSDEIPENDYKKSGKIKQFNIYFKRDLLSKISNIQYILINLLEAPLLALIIAYFTKYFSKSENGTLNYIFAYNENIPTYIFLSVIVAMFMGLSVSVEEIIRDRKLLEREAFLKLSRSSYYFSKILVLFIMSAIQTFFFVIIANNILEVKGMLTDYWIILFSTACFSNMLGLLISSCLKSVITAYIMIPLVLIPQIMFCGVVVDYEKLHKSIASPKYVPMIGDMILSRWAFEALMVNQFKSNTYENIFFETDNLLSRYSYLFNDLIPELEDRLNLCDSNMIHYINVDKTNSNLKLIETEILKLQNRYLLENKHRQKFKSVIEKNKIFRNYLEKLKKYSVRQYTILLKKREQLIINLSKSEDLTKLKLQNHNEKLADIVLNNFTERRIIEFDNELIQKIHPIYKETEQNSSRAHFYASEKKLKNISLNTYGYNLLVIWFEIILLYLLLYSNFLNFSSRYFIKKDKKYIKIPI